MLYVLSMILNIFPDIIYFQMHLYVSPCFCSGSTFHVHVAVENMHVHNALLNFVKRLAISSDTHQLDYIPKHHFYGIIIIVDTVLRQNRNFKHEK